MVLSHVPASICFAIYFLSRGCTGTQCWEEHWGSCVQNVNIDFNCFLCYTSALSCAWCPPILPCLLQSINFQPYAGAEEYLLPSCMAKGGGSGVSLSQADFEPILFTVFSLAFTTHYITHRCLDWEIPFYIATQFPG
jgi:hypothetical protein